ncbi:FKBP12-associated protein [Orbilia oligospora]|uniref:FKBP12-associated protein n=1 Tax=Orbilia oligospora TaxID=2813651 RepID=A0A7C8VIC0_ORBOL|nr:FKBP12-associated protein [Orbilia oligospora]
MADFTPPPPIQSQPQSQQQSTQNQTRNRRRRTPRPPREGPRASVESLGHDSEGHATADNTHSSSSIATPAFGAAGSSRPNQSNRNSGDSSRRDRTNASSGDSRRDRESTSSSNRGNRRGGRYGQTIRHPRTGASQSQLQSQSGQGEPTGTQDQPSSTNAAARGNTARQRARRGGNFASGGRQFGGQLTRPEATNQTEEGEDGGESSTVLRPEASTSTSGQPSTGNAQPTIVIESTTPSSSTTKPRRHRGAHKPPATLREAETLTTRIHTEISAGEYECMICYSSVTRKSKIWDCSTCYAVFHLHCIKKWAKQALDVPSASNDEIVPQRTWRCPGCQSTSTEAPDRYTCWCGKTDSPEVARFVPPHSCGQTCNKPREPLAGKTNACPHGCDLQCHAGPCPPCGAMGPQQPCFCGKEVSVKRCLDTNYENGWSCGQVCGDVMPCGEHLCERGCHGGVCGGCEVVEVLKCYCGETEKGIKCCDKLVGKASREVVDGEEKNWEGFWKCERVCGKLFDCGEHRCEKGCHSAEEEEPHCPFSPDVIKFCPCGKTELGEDRKREKCTDPIPHCDEVCGKVLPCGHECRQICHTGDCGLCMKTVDVFCRCGKTGSPSLCLQGDQGEKPMCRRVCHTTLNCLRHECGERCCSGEQKAKERMAAKKKVNVRGRTEDFEPEHICTRVCGKPLKCGSHDCSALCHRGACGSCLEASFDELACHCGRTRIMPPVPCGTKPPSCRFPCQRSKPCGHPNPTDHLCHLDDEACPNCPYLVQKRCVCGRTVIKNQPCYRDSVSCGQTCGLPLSCGSHICLKTCHAEGGCQEPCTQTCKKSRPLCGHDCQEACHAPFACSVNIPCAAKVTTSCPCGNVKQEVTCNTSMNNQHPKRPEIKCIDDCRRRQLAAAFNVDLEKKAAEEAINAYSDETLQFYIDNKVWCAGIEKMMREFCEDSGKVRLAFKPMKTLFRGFIHGLAEDYGLDSESQDPEPYRSVVVMKNGTWQMPIRVLADAVKVRRQEAALAAASSSVNATANGIQQLRKTTGLPAVNAILLSGLRVGLLTSELEKELAGVLRQGTLRFGIRWYGDEEVLLEPLPSSFSTEEVEVELGNVRGLVRRHCVVNRIASSVDLCYVGRDGKVTGKEGQGWNVVSVGKGIKAAAPPGPQTAGSYANLFGVLQQGGSAGSKGLAVKSDVGQRKDKVLSPVLPKEEPVDDWLEAVEAEEKAAASAAVSAAASGGEDNGGELSADEDGKEDVAAASTVTVVGTSDGTGAGTTA